MNLNYNMKGFRGRSFSGYYRSGNTFCTGMQGLSSMDFPWKEPKLSLLKVKGPEFPREEAAPLGVTFKNPQKLPQNSLNPSVQGALAYRITRLLKQLQKNIRLCRKIPKAKISKKSVGCLNPPSGSSTFTEISTFISTFLL